MKACSEPIWQHITTVTDGFNHGILLNEGWMLNEVRGVALSIDGIAEDSHLR
jgi:hypothetical protein